MSEPQHEQPVQPFIKHFLGLRRRMMWIVIGIVIYFLGMVSFAQQLYTFVAEPLIANLPKSTSTVATDMIAPFFMPVKVTSVAAFLLLLPHTLYQIWASVTPALYQNEERLIMPLVPSSVTLFFVGMTLAYFLVFPVIFRFLTGVTPIGVNMATDIDKYLSFVLGTFVAFNMTFEVPVAVVLPAKMGTVSTAQLKNARPYVIVGAFIVAVIITPPDVISQALLVVPLILLYKADIWFSRFAKVKTQQEDEDTPQPPAEI